MILKRTCSIKFQQIEILTACKIRYFTNIFYSKHKYFHSKQNHSDQFITDIFTKIICIMFQCFTSLVWIVISMKNRQTTDIKCKEIYAIELEKESTSQMRIYVLID